MAELKKKTYAETYKHQRGWGLEVWVENIPEYCGKLLIVEEGKRGSLHFHMDKLETMYLIEGNVLLKFVDPDTGKDYEIVLEEGDSIMIPRGQAHQIVGLKKSIIIEFSTVHSESDSLRIKKGD